MNIQDILNSDAELVLLKTQLVENTEYLQKVKQRLEDAIAEREQQLLSEYTGIPIGAKLLGGIGVDHRAMRFVPHNDYVSTVTGFDVGWDNVLCYIKDDTLERIGSFWVDVIKPAADTYEKALATE